MNAIKETIKNNRIVRHGYYFLKGTTQKKKMVKTAKETIATFHLDITENQLDEIALDIAKTYVRYGFDATDYLCFRFWEKSKKERLKFVADWEHLGYTCCLNDHKNAEIFDNKWKTYCTYRKFYGRDVLLCDASTDPEAFASFFEKHEGCIIKPLDASCGNGIKIINKSEERTGCDFSLLNELLKEYNGCFIIEELIVQAQEMAQFHPSSVNTVRIPTIRMDDEVKIIHPFMRMGQHGNVVDNAGAGGIICCVDVETGKIYAAADEKAKSFVRHPNSGLEIVGFTIPRWDEAIKLVKELALVVPDNRYTGWDVALTENGWILVEANRRGQFVWQMASQEGFREEINDILRKLKKKY